MPLHIFSEQIFETSNNQLSSAVERTGETAIKLFEQYYKKVLKSSSTQSESISEIFQVQLDQIEALVKEKTSLQSQRDSFLNELGRISGQTGEKQQILSEQESKLEQYKLIFEELDKERLKLQQALKKMQDTVKNCQVREVALEKEIQKLRETVQKGDQRQRSY